MLPLLSFVQTSCEFFATNKRLEARKADRPGRLTINTNKKNPAARIVYCSSSSEESDEAGESERLVCKGRVDSEDSKTDADATGDDYVGQVNQSLFVLEVTLNNLLEQQSFITNKSIFKDKLGSCRQSFVDLLKAFGLAGQSVSR